MIRELLGLQKSYLDRYFQSFDTDRAEAILQFLQNCCGTVVLSGVGKSGYVAQKIAATLLSTGTKAFFLDPIHAVHGDLGFVDKNDCFIAFSKSGESHELLDLLPFIRKRGVKCAAIVSNERSRLARASDLCISLPVERELCPFDLAPTTSTTVQLLFGDLLAVALMRSKQIPLGEIAQNHPGGWIGRRISLKVFDLMLKEGDLPLCRETDLLIDSLHELSAKRCGCLLVVDDAQRLLGMFTDGDLRRAIEKKGSAALQIPLKELMSTHPRTISKDALAIDALRQMEEDPSRLIAALPVLGEWGTVSGLLRMHDILQAGLIREPPTDS